MIRSTVVLFAAAMLAIPAVAQPTKPAETPKAPAPATPAAPAQPTKPAEPAKPSQPETPKPAAPAKEPAKETAKPATADAKLVYVRMSTTEGDIVLELNQEKAPISVANFLSYVDKKFYEGTIFHRVMPNFMIQGGGFDKDFKQKPTEKPIKNEWQNGLKNVRGSIAMARTGEPNSATSQFFINVVDNNGSGKVNLDGPNGSVGYAVFGKVVAGMDVVDRIKNAPTKQDGRENSTPVHPVSITTVTRITPEQAKEAEKGPQKPAAPAQGH